MSIVDYHDLVITAMRGLMAIGGISVAGGLLVAWRR